MKCTRPVLERCKTGPIEIVERPCGKCPACLATRAQMWTYRLYAESKLHTKYAFVTLTYSDEFISRLRLSPTGLYSLDKKEVQNFFKRLRKNLSQRIRFYAVGEYGGETKRPHYHAIIFGVGPEDRSIIENCWPFGFVTVSDVSVHAMAYVARYCVKKLFSDPLEYQREQILPEFSLMSNRPGIGFNAIDKGVRRSKDGQMFCWYQGRRIGVPQYFKAKIRTAVEDIFARRMAIEERDRRLGEFESTGRSELAEAIQAEKNRLARTSTRRKV
uniref:Replication-associated protein ORF2/G2P domain-containing protein n=1 Tax=uncultured Elusimicrobia bacterium TaxID=699876 RepID=A0A650EM88_9BACT|nr:hypothetical protein Elusimicrob1349_1960 [uncultured Elusimicrobia bacterium]